MYLKVLYSLLASIVTWGVTALGAGTVIIFNKNNQKTQNNMLGFSSGVMIAASFWSLITPAISYYENKYLGVLTVTVGLATGLFLMLISDNLITHLSKKKKFCNVNQNILLLVISITIHNIPEGLAIGVAFGACSYTGSLNSFITAFSVALGIAIQNFPEGAAVSLPLLNSGISKKKSFLIGQLSAVVEPIFAVLGTLLVVFMTKILSFCLAFAAGCMVYVVVCELIPETINNKKSSTISFFIGFIIMMILDVCI